MKGENSVKLFGNDLNMLEAKANEIQAQLKVSGLVMWVSSASWASRR